MVVKAKHKSHPPPPTAFARGRCVPLKNKHSHFKKLESLTGRIEFKIKIIK